MKKFSCFLLTALLGLSLGYLWRMQQEAVIKTRLNDAKKLIRATNHLAKQPGTMWIQLTNGQWICLSTKQLYLE